jgi:hypothetical protein
LAIVEVAFELLPLVGVLDLVLEDNVPLDYKTIGATHNLKEEAWQHDLQLTGYHLLIEDATGEAPGLWPGSP